MEAPDVKNVLPSKTRRPARSIKEIRQRQLGKSYQSPFDRILYAILNGVMYGVGGLLIDLTIVVIRSIAGIGNGDVFWLFTPFMLVVGAIMVLSLVKMLALRASMRSTSTKQPIITLTLMTTLYATIFFAD